MCMIWFDTCRIDSSKEIVALDCFGDPGVFSCLWGQFFYNKYPPRHICGDWRNPGDTIQSSYVARENFADACSTRILYRIDFLSSSASLFQRLFHLRTDCCPQRIIWVEPILPPNIRFVYHIVLLYIWYQPSLKKAWENVLPGHHLISSWCSDWPRNVLVPPKISSC